MSKTNSLSAILREGVDIFTEENLLSLAAQHLGLPYSVQPRHQHLVSFPVTVHLLNDLLRIYPLRQWTTDEDVLTLQDTNEESPKPTLLKFPKDEKPEFSLGLTMVVNPKSVHVVVYPTLSPHFQNGLPQFNEIADRLSAKLFHCLLEMHQKIEVHPTIRKINMDTPKVSIQLDDLGLKDLRKYSEVVDEFLRGNTLLKELAEKVPKVFEPNLFGNKEYNELYMTRIATRELLDHWKSQLSTYTQALQLRS